jgi:hypothetical protein
MSRQLREIAQRRAELASRAKRERRALAANKLWTSRPFLIAEQLLNIGRAIGSGTYMYYASGILQKLWPIAPLRWANRALRTWMTIDRMRKGLRR